MAIKKIGIIGLGNMGEVLLKGVLRIEPKIEIAGAESNKIRAEYIEKEYNIEIKDIKGIAGESNCVILAVKPQDAKAVLEELKGILKTGSILVSIMAGIKIQYIENIIGGDTAVIRVMPNTPAQAGKGVSVIAYNDKANADDNKFVKDLFSNLGITMELDESNFDIVTAVSGSGPAYFFYFVDAMIEGCIANGLDYAAAKELTVSTMEGSAELLLRTESKPRQLIDKVASKGGTTEAALKVFDRNKLNDIIKSAINEAVKRSKQLSHV